MILPVSHSHSPSSLPPSAGKVLNLMHFSIEMYNYEDSESVHSRLSLKNKVVVGCLSNFRTLVC